MEYVFALTAALLFAVASVLQQRAASEAPGGDRVRVGLLWHLVRRPMWLLGYGADWVAFGFQAAALGTGSLLVVQPLLVTGLLFALPFAAAWSGTRLGPQDWLAAVVLCAGLAGFLLLGSPSGGVERAPLRDWVIWGGIVVTVAVVCVAAAQRVRGSARAALLALATGVAYGLTSALTKSSVSLLGDGIVAFFTHWEPYALALFATAGMVVNQAAFQAGALSASLPTLTIAEPIVAALIGTTVFHEEVSAHGVLTWLGIALTIAAMVYGVIVLALRSAEVATPHPDEHGDATVTTAARP